MSARHVHEEPSDRIGLEERRRPWRTFLIGSVAFLVIAAALGAYWKSQRAAEWEETLAAADASGFFDVPSPELPAEGVATFGEWLQLLDKTTVTLGGIDGPKAHTPEFAALRTALRTCDREGGLVLQLPTPSLADFSGMGPEWQVTSAFPFVMRLLEPSFHDQKLACWKDSLRVARGLVGGRTAELVVAAGIVEHVLSDVDGSPVELDGEARAMLREIHLRDALKDAYRRELMLRRECLVDTVAAEGTSFLHGWMGRPERHCSLVLSAGMAWLEAWAEPHPVDVVNSLRATSAALEDQLESKYRSLSLRMADHYENMQRVDTAIGRHL